MVKNCKVILNNEAVTVVEYDDVEVQLPSIHKKKADFIKVIAKDGTYAVVEEDNFETSAETEDKPKEAANKKTTIKEGTKDNTEKDKLAGD